MMRCLIVDDEPPAVRVLQTLLAGVPDLEVVGACSSGMEAYDFLRSVPIDLLFLDIEMPDLSGLDLIRALEAPPRVVLTTAYREYAYEGFELDVVDYLLKPIGLPRLLKAVDKARKALVRTPRRTEGSAEQPAGWINVRADREVVKIPLGEVLYVESMSDYVKVILIGRVVVTRQRISELSAELEQRGFVRIHRSYLVPIARITAFSPESLKIGPKELPIGRTFRRKVMERLGYDAT